MFQPLASTLLPSSISALSQGKQNEGVVSRQSVGISRQLTNKLVD